MPAAVDGRALVVRQLGVSRETELRLAAYLELLARWTAVINLVGPSTMEDPWRRHILDSGQLFPLVPEGTRSLVDLGSGAGLPGMVLAIMGATAVTLVEADKRKAAFLRNVTGELGLAVHVCAQRIETLDLPVADVVTARALAPLDRLLLLSLPLLDRGSRCLFLAGRGVEAELALARRRFHMAATLLPSLSSPEGRVVQLDEVELAPTTNATR